MAYIFRSIAATQFLSNMLFIYFLCQLTCQSADIMSSLCGMGVRDRVRVNNFSSKTTRPRDLLFFLKDTLSIEDEKLFKACKSVFLLRKIPLPYPHYCYVLARANIHDQLEYF